MAYRLIERLTPAQEEAVHTWHAEFLAVGRCTEPANRPRAEAAITRIYAAIKREPPAFVWCDSPATNLLAIAVLGHSLYDSLRASLYDSLGG